MTRQQNHWKTEWNKFSHEREIVFQRNLEHIREESYQQAQAQMEAQIVRGSVGVEGRRLQLFAVQQARSVFFCFGKFSPEQLLRAQFSTVSPQNRLIRFALKIHSEWNTGIFDHFT
jgi:hypothetical protein